MADFVEVQFPTDISRGAKGTPEFKTTVVITANRTEQRIAQWDRPLWKYDVGLGMRTKAQAQVLQAFFLTRLGKAIGFRFKDWLDYEITVAENLVELTPTTFQIVKRYVSGGVTLIREITKPVIGTVKVFDGVTEILVGWTVDTTTGIITFGADPAYIPSVTCEFDVPVRFDTDEFPFIYTDYDWFDLTGLMVVEVKV